MEFNHIPVLFQETVDSLNIKPDGIYVDGTVGGAGHSREIASRLTSGRLIAFDQDPEAVAVARGRLEGLSATVVHSNFKNMKSVLLEMGIEAVDGILLDLGVSSHQLDTAERGFTHNADAPLDMRMDRRGELDAFTVVNTYSFDQLKKVIYNYGEERFAPKIASAIVNRREKELIKTTGELVDIIKSAIPAAAREGGHHPAKRTFQAIRIEVNGELDAIEPTIRSATKLLAPGGRIAIITFHSLEDRIVKQTYAELAKGCDCPKSLPICVCGKKPEVDVLTRKPILPSVEEIESNPRSRSAKLRIAEKI